MDKFRLFLYELFILYSLICSLNAEQNDNKTIKYLKFPFKRNLTLNNSMTPKQFFSTIIYNQIYIELIVGSNKQKIPFYLYLQQYHLVLQSSNSQKGEVKGIYDESKSSTYKAIEEENNFKYDDLVKGILSKDDFYFDSKPSIIPFYLSIENFRYSHITEGGKIGFKYWDKDKQPKKFQNLSFVKSLKSLGLISSYDFSFIYDSNNLDEDTGTLYIGSLLHDINSTKYNPSFFNITYSNLLLDGLWGYTIEKSYLGDKLLERSQIAYFYPEFGFISGSRKFFKELKNMTSWYKYFNISKKCHTCKFHIYDMDTNGFQRFVYEYTGYYCDKDVDVNKVINENLIFYSSDFRDIFNLKNEDIWFEKNEYKYFMILETLNIDDSWVFGKPFFKKYHITFNQDSKTIGVYTNIIYNKPVTPTTNNNKTIIFVCIIVGLVFIIGLLVFLISKFYFRSPRKKRANELIDDNFEYKSNDLTDNEIIPSEKENKN